MKKMTLTFTVIFSSFLMVSCGSSDKEPEPVQEVTQNEQPVQLAERSSGFYLSVNNMVDEYARIKDAFVEADMNMVKSATDSFMRRVETLDTNEIKKDTLIYEMIKMNVVNLNENARSMVSQKDITEMRRDFSGLSESLYTFLRSIKYKGPTLYFQNCPMAFNDNEPANWISKSAKVLNPYLGKKHPKYKAGMLNCGEIVDSIITKQ